MSQHLIDVLFESLVALITLAFILGFLRAKKNNKLRKIEGWNSIILGLSFILFGALIDITDEFDSLNFLIIIGDTPIQGFLEKSVGNLLGYLFLAIGIWRWIPKVAEHQRFTEEELKKTQFEVNVLQGLLPICSSCKNIRDDKGYWQELEGYIAKHSEASFSHSLCPDCAKRLYPQEVKDIEKQKKES